MVPVQEGSRFLHNPSFLPSLLWMLSMPHLPRSQEIGQQSKILVYYFRNTQNGQDDWNSQVNLFKLFVTSRKIKITAEAYLVSTMNGQESWTWETFLSNHLSPLKGFICYLDQNCSLLALGVQRGGLPVFLWLVSPRPSSWEESGIWGRQSMWAKNFSLSSPNEARVSRSISMITVLDHDSGSPSGCKSRLHHLPAMQF